MKERNYLVDCLRGFACLLVVIGHVMVGIRNAGLDTGVGADFVEKFIYIFHVALFMFLSGYVYKITGEWSRQGTRLNCIGHKLLNLGIPYVVFSFIYILMNSFTSGTNHESSIKDVLFIWKKPVAQYWFIYALLIMFIVWIFLSHFLSNKIILCIMTCVYFACVITKAPIMTTSLGAPISYFFIFGLGICIPELYIDKLDNTKKIIVLAVQLVVLSAAIVLKLNEISLLKIFGQMIGIMGCIAFISLLYNISSLKTGLLFINKHSFPIYLLHTIFTSAIRIVLSKVGITNYGVQFVMGCLMGVIFPILLAIIAEKTRILDFAFYPSKVIKRFKKK